MEKGLPGGPITLSCPSQIIKLLHASFTYNYCPDMPCVLEGKQSRGKCILASSHGQGKLPYAPERYEHDPISLPRGSCSAGMYSARRYPVAGARATTRCPVYLQSRDDAVGPAANCLTGFCRHTGPGSQPQSYVLAAGQAGPQGSGQAAPDQGPQYLAGGKRTFLSPPRIRAVARQAQPDASGGSAPGAHWNSRQPQQECVAAPSAARWRARCSPSCS